MSRRTLRDRIGAAMLELLPTRARRAWAAFSGARADTFKGAQLNRLTEDWTATLLHPDDEIRWNMRRLRARARDLERNNPYVRSYLRRLAVNVIGPNGIKVQAQIRDNSGKPNTLLNGRLEDGFAEWAEYPTIDGKLSLTRFSNLCLKTVARDGEVFVRKWFNFDGNRFRFALEAIDPDQVDEMLNRAADDGVNEIRLGVEVNSFGRPLAYHAWNKPDKWFGSSMGRREQIRIPAGEILHLYDPDRVNQTRGLTWFISVMLSLHMLDGYAEAELVAARLGASKMGFFQRRQGEHQTGEPVEDPKTGEIRTEANPGTFDFAPDGYEFQPWDPQHPNTQYGPFTKEQLRRISSGLGTAYNPLANDLEGVNYSSIRAGLLDERDNWRALQDWWVCAFLRPVYREWLNMALLAGAVKVDTRDETKLRAVKFSPRGWAWVDPLKDMQAAIAGIQTGLTSRQAVLAEGGPEEVDEVFEQLKYEKDRAAELGITIEAKPPAPIDDEEDDEDDDSDGKKKKAKTARAEVLEAIGGGSQWARVRSSPARISASSASPSSRSRVAR
jgi:lambda family phage portal protein